ncbi:GNAT acetyltransferase-like protein [Natranaerovirga hydrolytica]|uniref:GNAT acetyltransferase-like protein n=1 Tax=Natranaerovirga hydrolytica TaxID=680378 RepID=A0A4R1MXP3_9FIRM|nr:GNAT family N-acetyltransferase [Natranaerovirga hydrolytica]TCK98037.1 GNAT acetyltransferase-like protein [Natranaerovirga hydrolytica]
MELNKLEILKIVRKQLAVDMNCSEEDFFKDGIVFCEAKSNEGRRMFDRQSPFLEVATMGNSTVVSVDRNILLKVKRLFEGKSRDDIFAAPFLFGHSLYYIPDGSKMKQSPCPDGFNFNIKEGKDIQELYETPGFENAIQYDINDPRPDVIAIYAMCNKRIVAMAGASEDSSKLWQIGVDVLPKYRNKGLATVLVSKLTTMIMERGIVPYYGVSSTNIASQCVAYRSGFSPAWMCTYKNTFDGMAPYESDVKINIIPKC